MAAGSVTQRNPFDLKKSGVTPYALASYQKRSTVFTLLAGGIAVPVQSYQDYHYAHFEMTQVGQPLVLRVGTGEKLTEWKVSPLSFGIAAEMRRQQ